MSASEDRIVDLWNDRLESAREYRQHYEDRWIRNWELYRNKRRTTQLAGQDIFGNKQLPDPYRVIETMLPQHVLNAFRNRRWFSVEAPSAAGEFYQEVARALLLQGWRRADGYRKTILGMKMGAVLGHFIPKTVWKTEIGEREVVDLDLSTTADGEKVPQGFARRTVLEVKHNGPDIVFPDLFNLWQDPTGQGRWWIERLSHSSLSELKALNKQYGQSLYKNLPKAEASLAMGDIGKSHGYTQEQETLAEMVEGVPNLKDNDHIELRQCWGFVPESVKTYGDSQWRLQIIANGDTLIRDVVAPTYNHEPPYDNVQSIPIPGQIYGDSVLTYLEDLFMARSEIENMRLKDVAMNIFGTYAIDGRAEIQGQDLFKLPGGALRIFPEGGASIRDAIVPIQRQSALPDAYNESAAKERQFLDTSGATEPFQGTSFGGRTTATEVNMIGKLGTSRFALSTMWMDETFKKPVLERMFKYYQSRLTTEQAVQLAGKPELSGNVDLGDLRFDIDIHVDSGLFGSLDQTQFQNIMQMWQILSSNPETAVWIDTPKFVEKVSYRAGIEGSDDFIRTAEQVQQIMAQRRQQALVDSLTEKSFADEPQPAATGNVPGKAGGA